MGDVVHFPSQGQQIADFRAIYSDMKVDRGGNLILTMKVPIEHKAEALAVTDYPGMVVRVTVKREVIVYSESVVEELKRLGIDEFKGDGGSDA